MLVTTIIGYTLFYFLRKNLSLAMPGLAQDYGITKTSLGLFVARETKRTIAEVNEPVPSSF